MKQLLALGLMGVVFQLGCESSSVDGGAPDGGADGAASGGNVNGGTGGSGLGGNGSGETPNADDYQLLFRDDFDTLDTSRWQLMTHSWGTNLALFSADSVKVEGGELRATLLPAPEGTVDDTGAPKQFLGAEVRSTQTLTYGKVRARAKLAKGSAVVSSLVTIYTPWPADDWNELDIECLGNEPSNIQFNAMVYTGPELTPPVTESVTPTMDPEKIDVGFDPSEDYHVYTIEWTPSAAFFSVDDQVVRTWTQHIDKMDLAQNVLLTIWATSETAWGGAVDETTAGAFVAYDWVELYEFQGE
ncbi:MAG TPA: glycoside hydrolase family 16 protein [Polyangiaceae bacterium]|nr:glycoside hydrolase family 16 protein [Polyangiaceae bacterium]